MIYVWPLVIFPTCLAVMLGVAARLSPGPASRVRVYRVPPRWPVAELAPFPVDTEPLWLLSDEAAARDALARDVAVMVAAADELIPARWR